MLWMLGRQGYKIVGYKFGNECVGGGLLDAPPGCRNENTCTGTSRTPSPTHVSYDDAQSNR